MPIYIVVFFLTKHMLCALDYGTTKKYKLCFRLCQLLANYKLYAIIIIVIVIFAIAIFNDQVCLK